VWVNEMNKKVLIVGGAGFIGYHLARRLLEDGYYVDLIDNLMRGVYDSELRELIDQFDKVRFLNFDCLNLDINTILSRDYSYIFSMAAIVGVEHVMKSPYRVLVDNLKLLDNLIRVAQKQEGLIRFLYPSTSEVYAGTLENFNLPIDQLAQSNQPNVGCFP
jgi:UDP-glucose 4-epimerase